MTQSCSIVAPIAVFLAAVICGCSSDTGTVEKQRSNSPTTSRGEHSHNGGDHTHGGGEHAEGSEHATECGEHGRDDDGHHGAESEESGNEFALDETYDETRHGARLILAYDVEGNTFEGTVENTTDESLKRVRVEVHLSNGKELGPTTPADLGPGEKRDVKLTATSKDFDGWTAHPEVGSGEHGHEGEHGGEGQGEHDRDGGEHGQEGGGEHS